MFSYALMRLCRLVRRRFPRFRDGVVRELLGDPIEPRPAVYRRGAVVFLVTHQHGAMRVSLSVDGARELSRALLAVSARPSADSACVGGAGLWNPSAN